MNHLSLNSSLLAPKLGHTLDLVLMFGFPTHIMEIIDACLSDHSTILFDASPPSSQTKPPLPARFSRFINSSTASKFSDALIAVPNTCIIEPSLPPLAQRLLLPY